MKPDICIYHDPCMDGTVAAWAAWRRWPDIEFIGAKYGDPLPDVDSKHVVIVDFSYPKGMLEQMAATAASVTVLDHHKTAHADLAEFATSHLDLTWVRRLGSDNPIVALFDMDRSGARLAWDFFHPMEPAPRLVKHVEDRDLWRFEMGGTREVFAWLASLDKGFSALDMAYMLLEREDDYQRICAEGAAIMRAFEKDVAAVIAATRRWMQIGNYLVPVANLPFTMASEGGNLMSEGQPFAASYFDGPDGRKFSLRASATSRVDVSAIAKLYGGGGHAKAAGFSVERGWEGERPDL